VNPQRILIIAGAALLIVGLAWPLLTRLGLGRLPGDIVLRKGGMVFYAPLMTSLIASVVLSLILWLLRR
jgi:uncharacterized protein HemY